MGDEGLTFKVTDRRHSADREEVSRAAEGGPGESQPTQQIPAPDTRRPGERAPGVDLAGIFAMFATSALVSLGEAGDPAESEHSIDLEQARAAIDALIVLREKTEGNRTPGESQLLDGVLYDLQMRYVRGAKGGRAP